MFSELNYCENNPDTCKNGAKCVSLTNEDGNYKCLCREGTMGKNCEKTEYTMSILPLNTTMAPSSTITEEITELFETSTSLAAVSTNESNVEVKPKSKNKFFLTYNKY